MMLGNTNTQCIHVGNACTLRYVTCQGPTRDIIVRSQTKKLKPICF